MSYVRNNLLANEEIRFETTLHWAVFLKLASILTLGLYGFFLRSTHEYVVTNRRVMIRVGWLQRHTLELLLNKVETVEVHQDLWGRMLGYGTIEISGTGGSTERFPGLSDPLGFRRAVHEAADLVQDGPAAPARTATERLAELDALRDAGTISEAEHAAARQRILGAL